MVPPVVAMPDTLRGVDDLIRSNLEAFAAQWIRCLIAYTAIVAFGLFLELPELWYETIESFKEIFHCSNNHEHRPSPWAKISGAFGWLLIVVGVGGECLAEGFLFKADELVIKFDEIVLMDTTTKAGTALERAARAELTARAFQLQIAKVNERAAQLDLERTKLEAIIAPRSLTLEQQQKIADICRKFQGHPASVVSYSTDAEASGLASQIIAVLHAAGVPVVDNTATVMPLGGFEIGIHVRAPNEEKDFAVAIDSALSSIGHLDVASPNDPLPKGTGISSGGQHFNDPKLPFVTITVGVKRVPILPLK
jgi:hypothetical protein